MSMGDETETVTLRDGSSVTVRGLSGYEAMLATKMANGDQIRYNAGLVALGMVDPDFGGDGDQALAWMKRVSAGDFQRVMNTLERLSGIGGDALQEAAKSSQ